MRSKSSFHRLHSANGISPGDIAAIGAPIVGGMVGGPAGAAVGAGIGGMIAGSGVENKINTISGETAEEMRTELQSANEIAMGLIDQSAMAIQAGIEAMRQYATQGANAMTQYTQQAVKTRIVALKDALAALAWGINAGEGAIEKWTERANQKLEPLIKQGDFALDEMASMLGIPGRDGKVHNFDFDKLRQTPGYEFMFTESVRAVEQAAVGKKMSSQTIDRVKSRAEENAALAFNTRFSQLGQMAGPGVAARTAQAQILANAGIGLANMYQGAAGSAANAITALNPSDLYANLGARLGQIYSDTGARIQQGFVDLGKVNLAGAQQAYTHGSDLANVAAMQGGAQMLGAQSKIDAMLGAGGLGAYIYGSSLGKPPTTETTPTPIGIGNPISTVNNTMPATGISDWYFRR